MKNDKISSESKQNSSSVSRRKALRNIVVSGSVVTSGMMMPEKWARPVVDSIILPSHALTTDETGSQNDEATELSYFIGIKGGSVEDQLATSTSLPGNFAERVLDTLIPTAQANNHRFDQFNTLLICIGITGTSFKARITRYINDGIYDYTGITGTVGSTTGVAQVQDPCDNGSASSPTNHTILIDQVTPGSCRCTLNTTGQGGVPVVATVPVGSCQSPDLNCNT